MLIIVVDEEYRDNDTFDDGIREVSTEFVEPIEKNRNVQTIMIDLDSDCCELSVGDLVSAGTSVITVGVI